MDLKQLVQGVVITKQCSVRPHKDSKESKNINIAVKFDNVALEDVFAKAVSGVVIQWQNGPGRSKFDQWTNNQVVKVNFKSPAKTQVDPESAMVAKLATMTPEAQLEYLQALAAKANKA